MKNILGLDPGTSSLGWGLVDIDNSRIIGNGVRIIPMTQDVIGAYESGGNVTSPASQRTTYRSIRRLIERRKLRRERLHRALSIMGFLPDHYLSQLDRYGKILPNKEPKIAWDNSVESNRRFLFMNSYNEMLTDFARYQPQLLLEGRSIPYDWTIYYLRKKALSQALSKEELSWILLQFNQKRGYYQTRSEVEKTNTTSKEEFLQLTINKVEKTDEKKGSNFWYNVYFKERPDLIYRRASKFPLDWENQKKDFILTTQLEKDGSPTLSNDGIIKYSMRQPTEKDWNLQKIKAESSLNQSGTTLGAYIYNMLLQHPDQKIIGQIVRTIDRQYYIEEARSILEKQKEFIPELNNQKLYNEVIFALYPSNDAYRNGIANRDFIYLFVDDILFYQRPLKSKKYLISSCPFEKRVYKNISTGDKVTIPIKCIAQSNPYFQEFRIWQFISNLRIYLKDDLTNTDVTDIFVPDDEAKATLFEWLNNLASIKQSVLLKHLIGKDSNKYRWNYVEDKEYPCNRTRHQILTGLAAANIDTLFLTRAHEYELWHIIYSVTDKKEYIRAIRTFAQKHNIDSSFVEVFSKMKPFSEDGYGAYSEKAIKKLLALMRCGKYWDIEFLDPHTKDRILKCINGEVDDSIDPKVREIMLNYTAIEQLKGLPNWKASYIVYGPHSNVTKWESPEDIDIFLNEFKQNSLHNPIVEQVILETMRVVRDIWKKYGKIDEIHIEVGRDLKNPKDKRASIATQIKSNEEANMRIRMLLSEMADPEFKMNGVKPYSPSQQELLRIYEEDVWNNQDNIEPEIIDIHSRLGNTDPQKRPSKSEILRYKLWLDQKYRSPYTGQPIPLSELFTVNYEIEHVIPQARFFDDSFNNKVICEKEVNSLKGKLLGMEFISNNPGRIVTLSGGRTVTILDPDSYRTLVKNLFSANHQKLQRLLMEDIPDSFIQRQLNDSRYISRYILGLLSNIVREKDENGNLEVESISKNIVVCNGKITSYLKKDWGIFDVWNRLILPRFERMNTIDTTHVFTSLSTNGHKIPDMPIEFSKGFDKKRIDHRHHAMDAIVIACCTRDHVNLISNESAMSKNIANRYALSHKLRNFTKENIDGEIKNIAKEFKLPWNSFPQDCYNALSNIIVSFKQNQRIINKLSNKYYHFEDGQKKLISQDVNGGWAIRKPLHKETSFGEINLKLRKTITLSKAILSPNNIVDQKIKNKVKELLQAGLNNKNIIKYFSDNVDTWPNLINEKVEVYYWSKDTNDRYFATRQSNDLISLFAKSSAPRKEDEYKNVSSIITSITDTGIQKILWAHYRAEDENAEKAFSPEGIERLNRNIQILNNGKPHKPIKSVRVFEKSNKFPIGTTGNKASKFVENAKDTNLFFVIYKEKDNNSRQYATLPLNMVIDCQKRYLKEWKKYFGECLSQGTNSLLPKDSQILYILSPNDLVYVPTIEQITAKKIDTIDNHRIYKMVSASGKQCFFIQHHIASSIVNKVEFSSSNKMEKAISGEQVKAVCIPIKVDRLGNIIQIESFWN